jgi:hypothetical protein
MLSLMRMNANRRPATVTFLHKVYRQPAVLQIATNAYQPANSRLFGLGNNFISRQVRLFSPNLPGNPFTLG